MDALKFYLVGLFAYFIGTFVGLFFHDELKDTHFIFLVVLLTVPYLPVLLDKPWAKSVRSNPFRWLGFCIIGLFMVCFRPEFWLMYWVFFPTFFAVIFTVLHFKSATSEQQQTGD